MHIISLEETGEIRVTVYLDESQIPENQPNTWKIDKENLPEAPVQTWEILDGVVTVNPEKLAAYHRSIMPSLSPLEFDLKLVHYNLYDAIQALIATNLQLKIAYTRAISFSRTNPFIEQARIALNLTNEQVDEIWMN